MYLYTFLRPHINPANPVYDILISGLVCACKSLTARDIVAYKTTKIGLRKNKKVTFQAIVGILLFFA